jgi:hypothetical protein
LGNATLELSHRGNSPWRGPLRRRHASGPRKWRSVPLQASAGRRYARMLLAETVGHAPFGASSPSARAENWRALFRITRRIYWPGGRSGIEKCAARANTLISGRVGLPIIDCWSVHKLLDSRLRYGAAPRVRSLTGVRRESGEWGSLAVVVAQRPAKAAVPDAGRTHRQSGEELG